jgi:hypothetical protein
MAIASGLFNLVLISPVNAIVNGSIHLGSLRKGYTLPAVRISEVTTTPIVANTGTAALQYSRFQFDAFAGDYNTAHALRDALKGLLTDYTGTLAEGTTIFSSILMNELDSPLEEGTGGYTFRCLLDYEFAFDSTGTYMLIPEPNVELDIYDDEWPLGRPY